MKLPSGLSPLRTRRRAALPTMLAVTSMAAASTVAVTAAGVPSAQAACSAAPTYSSSTTKFGVSLTTSGGLTLAQSLAKQETNFTRLPIVRIFDPGVPPSNAWARRTPVLGTRASLTSFRMSPQDVLAGKYDSAMRTFFSTAPTNAPVLWNYIHEPEPMIASGQFTAAQYRSAFQRLANLAAGYCRTNLFPTMVLTGWTTNPSSGRRWQDYYPGASYTSVVAFDPYNNAFGKATAYTSPSTLFDSTVAAAKATGKPWGIAETGTNRIGSDSTGSGRAAWLKAMGAYFKTNGAKFVTYFQSTANGDFELRDQASIAAYRALVDASN